MGYLDPLGWVEGAVRPSDYVSREAKDRINAGSYVLVPMRDSRNYGL